MIQTTYLGKTIIVLGLVVAAMVGLSMVQELGANRQEARELVAQDIEAAAGGSYHATAPMLAVVVSERWQDATAGTELVAERSFLVMPTEAQLSVTSAVETRYRGMFPARVATTKQVATTSFALDEALLRTTQVGGQVTIVEAYVVLGLASARGITRVEGTAGSGEALRFVDRGAALEIASGVLARQLIAPLGERALLGLGHQPLAVTVELEASGGEAVTLVPLAATNTLTLQSNWPHLKYGQRLPTARTVGPQGSLASWRFDGASLGHKPFYHRNETSQLAEALAAAGITATFVEPVDIYLSLERAVKYGWLIVLVTLALVLLYDHTRAMRLHPAQYGMIAAALVIFFVVLLSLGEHVGFVAAYAAAAAVTCALCAGYLALLFGRLGLGVGFAGYFAGVYVALYVMLRSEDFALLLGSALLLVGLAVAMWLTRGLHREAGVGATATPLVAADAPAIHPQ